MGDAHEHRGTVRTPPRSQGVQGVLVAVAGWRLFFSRPPVFSCAMPTLCLFAAQASTPADAPAPAEAGAAMTESERVDASLASDLKSGLQKQRLRGLDEHGDSITIMAVGEAGVGKTTLFSNLFLRDLSGPPGPTLAILEQTVHFDLDGVPFSAKLVDTPGYGDLLDLRRTFALATNYLDACFARSLAQERAIRRSATEAATQNLGVDVILYFFAPHRAKAIDYAFLRRLQGRAPIVPVLAKGDTAPCGEGASLTCR